MNAPVAEGRARAAALTALIGGALAIGAAPILVRLAEAQGSAPTSAAFWRVLLALPLLAVWARLDRPSGDLAPLDNRRARRLALLAGLLFAGDLATWHAGIVRTTAANATLLPNLTPVIIAGVAWLVFKERLGRPFLLGLGAALAGVALLSGVGEARLDPERALGDALCLLTAVWYAAYFLVVRAARRSWSAGRVMFVASLATAPPLLLAALAFGEPLWPAEPGAWMWLAGLGVVHAVGQGGIAFGLGRLPATLSSVVVLVQPVAAAGLGWLVFSERLGPLDFLGAALVLIGVLVAQRAQQRQAARAPG